MQIKVKSEIKYASPIRKVKKFWISWKYYNDYKNIYNLKLN